MPSDDDRFEWDEQKSAATFAERGFDFVFASRIFDGPTIEAYDEKHSDAEDRYTCIGQVDGVVLFVVVTMRGERRRIYLHAEPSGGYEMNGRDDLEGGRKGRFDPAKFASLSEADIESQAIRDYAELGIDPEHLQFYAVPMPQSIDVRALRKRLGLSQTEFAATFGLNVRTVQHWEQGRTKPDAPARNLLTAIAHDPSAVHTAVWWQSRNFSKAAISPLLFDFVSRQLEPKMPVERSPRASEHDDPNAGKLFAA